MKKNKFYFLAIFLFVINAGCASERLYVRVTDNEGKPVSNAVVRVGFSTSNVLFGGGHSSHSKSGHAEAKTDTEGNAVVKFNCKNASFGWDVEADGYYRSNSRREQFKFDEIIVPPCFVKVVLHEHEKHREIVLYPKKNPQPMYMYSRGMGVKSPIKNGRYGFDLQLFDWLPPYGKGKNADFFYVRERLDETNSIVKAKFGQSRFFLFKNGESGYPKLGDIIGRIEFEKNCGAYVEKKTGCKTFPSLYCADINKDFKSSFPISIVGNDNWKVWLQESSIISDDEYMVIRSRVKYDEDGNIVSYNYSKILGSFGLSYKVSADEIVFNPRPNDTNLEFDPKRNLYQGKTGRGMVP